MKLINLHFHKNNGDLYINPTFINYMYSVPVTKDKDSPCFTRIWLGENHYCDVKETPQEIYELANMADLLEEIRDGLSN